jgi:hypothetical protein
MGILRNFENGDAWSEAAQLADYCFLCSKPLTLPAVYWHGGEPDRPGEGTELWLHPECAKGLAARITRDAIELEQGKQAADEWLRDWKKKSKGR